MLVWKWVLKALPGLPFTSSSPIGPFCRHALFPPPSETWLQRVSLDPKAQGWGVWSWTEKTPLKPEGGKVEDNEEDTGFPPFLLDREDLSEDLAEYSVWDQVTASWSTAAWSIRWRLAGDLGHLCMGAVVGAGDELPQL